MLVDKREEGTMLEGDASCHSTVIRFIFIVMAFLTSASQNTTLEGFTASSSLYYARLPMLELGKDRQVPSPVIFKNFDKFLK